MPVIPLADHCALLTEHETGLKAVVIFGAAGYSWDRSPQLRTRLYEAAKNITVGMKVYAQNDYSINPGYAIDSVMNQVNKPHILKIYPSLGNSRTEGHNMIFSSPATWEADVFKFLNESIRL